MTSEAGVYVTIGGVDVLAGRLYSHRRRNAESASFIYTSAYLRHPGAYALDPELPMTTGTHQVGGTRALFGAFADSSPDRWGRTLIQRAERMRANGVNETPRSIGEFDMLLGVRDDLRQGAVRFRVDDDGPFMAAEREGVPPLTDLGSLLALATRAERETADYDDLRRLLKVGSSLGGARPKAHVIGPQGGLAIAKFPSVDADAWDVMRWEKTALDLAARSGIAVPHSQLLAVGNRGVLVVARFDRIDSTRVGYASAMTMLRASDGDQRSYLEIAEVIEELSPEPTADLHELWRRMAFSVLIHNTDDHLRNHGFLHAGLNDWTLAPAFDINPNPESGPTHLATTIGLDDGLATIENLMTVTDYFRLSMEMSSAVLAKISDATSRWRSVAAMHGLGPSSQDQMAGAFEHDQAAVARRMAV